MTIKRKKPSTKKVKAQVWTLFSRYIRLRDCLASTGTIKRGRCITCQKEFNFNELQAGHFIAGRHNANLFSKKGTHSQCRTCNILLHGNQLEYRRQIIRLYGEGYDEILEAEARQIKQFSLDELEKMKEYYSRKVKEMEGK